ncbi:MAG: hypothetical protein EZS28_027812, partial [Streblomastix strix]
MGQEHSNTNDPKENIVVPTEYNIISGLIGLGPDILLEILNEMNNLPDAQKFLIICKKTFELMKHSRFTKIIESLRFVKYTFLIPDKKYRIAESNQFIHLEPDFEHCTVALNPVLSNGIFRIEFIFVNHDEGLHYCVGIAESSCVFGSGKGPDDDGNDKKTVRYWNDGDVGHIGYNYIKGNKEFKCGQKVAIEANLYSKPFSLRFFIDNEEQQNNFIYIPSEIRFW